MAIRYSEIAMDQNGSMTGTAPLKGDGGLASATVCIATAIINVEGTEAVGDVINLVRLPKNAVVVSHLCRVSGMNLGMEFSIKVGTDVVGEGATYSDALNIAGVHDLAFGGGVRFPVEHDAPYWVTASVSAVTSPIKGAKTVVFIVYRIN
ncbi:MAG: hypothetical protein RR553_03265 [Akkermansia sp.]